MCIRDRYLDIVIIIIGINDIRQQYAGVVPPFFQFDVAVSYTHLDVYKRQIAENFATSSLIS